MHSPTTCSVCDPISLNPVNLFTSHLPTRLVASISTFFTRSACWELFPGLHLAPGRKEGRCGLLPSGCLGCWAPAGTGGLFSPYFSSPSPSEIAFALFCFPFTFYFPNFSTGTVPRPPDWQVGEGGGDRTFAKCLPCTRDKPH